MSPRETPSAPVPGELPRPARIMLGGALAVAAGLSVLALAAVVLRRVGHPLELNWMEGAMADHVTRVLAGHPLYVPPSLDFVPFLYPPLYYWASALVGLFTGEGFLALRLVSIFASIGLLALSYALVTRETGNRFAGIAAAGLFAATYHLSGSYLDVGRVDTLFLFLMVLAIYVQRFHPGHAWQILAGVLVGLAFLTKQSAVVIGFPIALYLLSRRRRADLVAVVTAIAAMAGGTLLLTWTTDGWYWYYVFDVPTGAALIPSHLIDFWRLDVVPPLAVAWVLALAFLVTPGDRDSQWFHLSLAAGLVVSAWLPRAHQGGNINLLIPAFLAVSLWFGLGIHGVMEQLRQLAPRSAIRGAAWLALAILLQFGLLAYDPRGHLPRRADVAEGARLVAVLRQSEGPVWVPYHGHLARRAGHAPQAHWMALTQVLDRDGDPLAAQLRLEIEGALRERHYRLIVTSTSPFPNDISPEGPYRAAGDVTTDPLALWPVAGARRRPAQFYRPE